MTDPMTPEELQACRERADLRSTFRTEDVPRLLATIVARDEDLRKLRRGVVANAGRLSLRGPAPRWSHVMSAAGLGSTSAKDLCVAAGFDPDEEVGSWPEPCAECAEDEEEGQ